MAIKVMACSSHWPSPSPSPSPRSQSCQHQLSHQEVLEVEQLTTLRAWLLTMIQHVDNCMNICCCINGGCQLLLSLSSSSLFSSAIFCYCRWWRWHWLLLSLSVLLQVLLLPVIAIVTTYCLITRMQGSKCRNTSCVMWQLVCSGLELPKPSNICMHTSAWYMHVELHGINIYKWIYIYIYTRRRAGCVYVRIYPPHSTW